MFSWAKPAVRNPLEHRGPTLVPPVEIQIQNVGPGLPRVEAPDGWVKKVERAHVSVFPQRDTLLLTLIILVIALISRLFGCGLGALRLGWSDPVRLGVGMMPRGEVGLVVAQIGLGFGVMPVQIYAAVVFMSLATTILAPPMLNRAFRHVHPVEPVEDFMIR